MGSSLACGSLPQSKGALDVMPRVLRRGSELAMLRGCGCRRCSGAMENGEEEERKREERRERGEGASQNGTENKGQLRSKSSSDHYFRAN